MSPQLRLSPCCPSAPHRHRGHITSASQSCVVAVGSSDRVTVQRHASSWPASVILSTVPAASDSPVPSSPHQNTNSCCGHHHAPHRCTASCSSAAATAAAAPLAWLSVAAPALAASQTPGSSSSPTTTSTTTTTSSSSSNSAASSTSSIQSRAAAVAEMDGFTPIDPSTYVPGPVEVGWEIYFGALIATIPFVIGAYEFGKRILIQRRCQVCGGSGLVTRGRFQRKCPQCGGFFPWVSWRMFLSANATPGNGGPLQQPKGQTSVFYSVPPPPATAAAAAAAAAEATRSSTISPSSAAAAAAAAADAPPQAAEAAVDRGAEHQHSSSSSSSSSSRDSS